MSGCRRLGGLLLAAVLGSLPCHGLPRSVAASPGAPAERGGGTVEVDRDPLTGSPTTVRGVGGALLTLAAGGSALSREEVAGAGPRLVQKYADLLRIRPDQVRLLSADEVGDTWYLSYQQVADGLGVQDSSLGFSVEPGGRIESLGARLYPDARDPGGPTVARDAALAAARGHIRDYREKGYSLRDEGVVIFPERGEKAVSYRRAYRFEFAPGKGTHPAAVGGGWSIFVDAGSGKVVAARTLFKPLGCCLPPEGLPASSRDTKTKGGKR